MTDHLETKSETGPEISAALDDLMRAFSAFRDTNDERLAELERRAADPLTTDKLARIEGALDELAHKAMRPQLSITAPRIGVAREHKASFEGYVRRGETAHLRALEGKALSVVPDADGGYLVPEETERAVNRALRDISPIRAIAGIRQVSGTVYKKPFALTGAEAGWVAETAARPTTDSPTLTELSFPTMELYAMPAATQSLLDDSAVDIDQWIAEEVRTAFAEQEGTAFVTGDGTAKPKGLLSYTAVANASWTWGSIGFIASGAAGAFPGTDPADKLIDLVHAVKAGYRANAHFLMNRATLAVIRRMKDGEGNYLWAPSMKPGEAATIMGFPVAESEDMPNIAANSLSLAFGDFRRGYLIVDRLGIRVLRDPYSSKPYVLFYTVKRVGGGVQDFDAIKLMKFAA